MSRRILRQDAPSDENLSLIIASFNQVCDKVHVSYSMVWCICYEERLRVLCIEGLVINLQSRKVNVIPTKQNKYI